MAGGREICQIKGLDTQSDKFERLKRRRKAKGYLVIYYVCSVTWINILFKEKSEKNGEVFSHQLANGKRGVVVSNEDDVFTNA